jgi:hypothetical protein
MSEKYVREKHLVELLMRRLGISALQYIDPNAERGQEAGVDVVAVVATGRIGIQVTELDTGSIQGRSRAQEKKAARDAERSNGGVYSTWAQNDPAKVLESITRSISKKSVTTSIGGFHEFWLLISCGVPELGSVGSTFVMTRRSRRNRESKTART